MRISELFVLVVEPSKLQRKLVLGHLEKLGITSIAEAESAKDALGAIASDQPDLVLSSLHLPDSTGAALLGAIRSNEKLEDVAFILISSETQFRYLDPVKQGGATAVLPKPFTDGQLRAALKTTVHNLQTDGSGLEEDFDLDVMRVLLVDDSPMSRKHIRKTLQQIGFQNFVEVGDGNEALSMMADDYFDLVVTDYNMPNLDGQELTQHIRTKSSQQSVPILMVTSEENEGRLAGIQQSGVSALCDKPFAVDSVRQMLSTILA